MAMAGLLLYFVYENKCGPTTSRSSYLIDFGVNMVYLILLVYQTIEIIRNKKKGNDGAESGFIKQLIKRVDCLSHRQDYWSCRSSSASCSTMEGQNSFFTTSSQTSTAKIPS